MITEALTCVGPDKLRRTDGAAVDWIVADGLVDYPLALDTMKARAAAISRGEAPEAVWLVEHPPLYTAGTSARPPTCWNRAGFPSMPPAAAANTLTTGPASAWPT
jgi:lipoyl(octanoyl) transferase